MNVFLLHHEPRDNARLYCDEHVKACGIQYAELLAGTFDWTSNDLKDFAGQGFRVRPGWEDPCAKWLQAGSRANYDFLLALTQALWDEHHRRTGRKHPASDVWTIIQNKTPSSRARIGSRYGASTELGAFSSWTVPPVLLPPPCIVDSRKPGNKLFDAIDSYKNYYKFIKGNWTHTDEPKWMAAREDRYVDPNEMDGYSQIGDLGDRMKRALSFHELKKKKDETVYAQQPAGFKSKFKRIY